MLSGKGSRFIPRRRDGSTFHTYELGSYFGVSTMGDLLEHLHKQIRTRHSGKTEKEMTEVMKGIEIKQITLGDWKGYDVIPADVFHAQRSLFLEHEGTFFRFNRLVCLNGTPLWSLLISRRRLFTVSSPVSGIEGRKSRFHSLGSFTTKSSMLSNGRRNA